MSCFHISKYSKTRPISDGLRENNVNYYSLLNRYLKRIAEICRIKRNWVFHCLRHSYIFLFTRNKKLTRNKLLDR